MISFLAAALLLAAGAKVAAPANNYDIPHAPYRIAEDIYYVGTQGIGVYLIETGQGLIVIDSGTKDGVKLVEANIQALGFTLKDVRYLLETHAHWDHVGGMAQLKKDTGAQFIASGGDRYGLEHGVHVGENSSGPASFAPVAVDRVINDGDNKVKLGGVTLTAVATPGHTRGDTT
ncbi:MAG: metallo-beta-lactamase, partial [Asticcacaulis sp.]|nr:metallo-beta-lactamase [Asticcacaulis sp.]